MADPPRAGTAAPGSAPGRAEPAAVTGRPEPDTAGEPAAVTGGPAPDGGPGRRRLDDAAVRERLDLVDGLLEQVERAPGPTAELAMDAVATLLEVYGEALARAADHAAGAPAVIAAMTGDELLTHLFALHDVHPDPVERRAERALEMLRPRLGGVGAEAELVGVDGGAATVVVRADGGCGAAASAAAGGAAVREAVLAAAPELSDVRVTTAAKRALVPLDALRRGPATLEQAR
ncbi:MAG: NifU family protein [Frankia sp.]|nr:NifU family protein [Frankia sp.]